MLNHCPAPHKDKDIRRFIDGLVAEGWKILGGRKHYKVRSPGGRTLSLSNTPSCPYMLKHVEADVRRIKRMEDEQITEVHGDCPCGGET